MLHFIPCTLWSYSSGQMSSGVELGLGLGILISDRDGRPGSSDFDFLWGFLSVVWSFSPGESPWARRSALFSILALNFRFFGEKLHEGFDSHLAKPVFLIVGTFSGEETILVGITVVALLTA